jgi:uncharacterized protein YqjF (DUF2071 family)
MDFLKAEWRRLIVANYEVPASLLASYVPAGTVPDLWRGRCMLSLVGFMFLNTRVWGLKIPAHVHFEEVNLRFYVQRQERGSTKRGVSFIKEIVPKPAIAWVANTLYHEHYEAMPMRYQQERGEVSQKVVYEWKKGGRWHSLEVEASTQKQPLLPESEAAFILEHYWGYSWVNRRETIEYEVKHPSWLVYEVQRYRIDVDFKEVYGKEFAFLNSQAPCSVFLAEGSAVRVSNRRKIRIK